jgi:hypothetical protein
MSRTIILAGEESITAGVGNSSTVGNATVVRVFNDSGSDLTITVTDPTGDNSFSGVGSISMPDNHVEYIEKPASYTIYGSANFKAAKVGFTG